MSDERNSLDQDGEISLRAYFETIWRYRQVIGVALVLVCALYALAVFAFKLRFPEEKVASVQFRLMFEGAAQDQYPNGIPFSPTDIVGAPVVTEVFKGNDLQRFGPYEYFKQALYVQQASPELYNLASEYQAKLADNRISPVERARIEEEYKNKRKAMVDPVFLLSLRRSERFTELPAGLVQKVLTDVLTTWAEQADTRKGALRYQVPVLSSKILSRENIANDDYLVSVDLLRARAVRIVRTIDEFEKLPGALTLRTKSDRMSLSEIRANLEDSIRFDLEPLLGIIRSEGVTKNALQLSLYASNMAFQIRLDKQEIEGRAAALRAGLNAYLARPGSQQASDSAGRNAPSVVPQLSETFVDRLQEMFATAGKEELEYRRKLTDQLIDETRRATTFDRDLAYYEELAKAVKGIGSRSTGTPELINLIKARTDKAYDLIAKSTDQLSAFYEELSAQNLGPASRLYTVTRPFAQHTENSLSSRIVWLLFWFVLLGSMIVVPIGCLIHDAMRKRAVARAGR